MATIPLSPVDTVRVTILMDNVTDPLLFPTPQVERITWLYHLAKPRAASTLTDDGLPDGLIAEPGFSALVRVTTGGRERAILFDAGVTPTGVVEHMPRVSKAVLEDRGSRRIRGRRRPVQALRRRAERVRS